MIDFLTVHGFLKSLIQTNESITYFQLVKALSNTTKHKPDADIGALIEIIDCLSEDLDK